MTPSVESRLCGAQRTQPRGSLLSAVAEFFGLSKQSDGAVPLKKRAGLFEIHLDDPVVEWCAKEVASKRTESRNESVQSASAKAREARASGGVNVDRSKVVRAVCVRFWSPGRQPRSRGVRCLRGQYCRSSGARSGRRFRVPEMGCGARRALRRRSSRSSAVGTSSA